MGFSLSEYRGIKRSLLVLMVVAVPMASSEPISLWQEAAPAPIHGTLLQSQTRSKVIAVKKSHKRKHAAKKIASWYSETDPGINLHTANGEIFDDRKMTCASWDYSFGTLLRVTNVENGKSVVCRVNDRGPNKRLGRYLDLTIHAFRRIANPRSGLIRVSVAKLDV